MQGNTPGCFMLRVSLCNATCERKFHLYCIAFHIRANQGQQCNVVRVSYVKRDHAKRDITSMPADESRQFEATAHNIFTPQPVKYARAYYMHSVPHGFGDEDAIKIMANLVPALAKGYSRVLLNEIVISEEKPILVATNMDMIMLAHLAVRKRTEPEWRYIFTQAGLKVINIYSYPGEAESLIEAELA